MTQGKLAIRLGLCMLVALFGVLFAQGLPAKDGPRACYMEDAAGHRTDFLLTVREHVMLIDLGDAKLFVFPINPELSDDMMTVGAIGEPGKGSVSVLLEATGKFQQTFLLPGRSPEFFYGECR